MAEKIAFCQYLPSAKSRGGGSSKTVPVPVKSFTQSAPVKKKGRAPISHTSKASSTKSGRHSVGATSKKVPSSRTFMSEAAPVAKRGGGRSDAITEGGGSSAVGTSRRSRLKSPSLTKLNSQDYDILHIDTHIRNRLKGSITTIPELQKDLKTLLWILNNSDDPLDRIQARTESSILRKRIQDIEHSFEYGFYILRTTDLLEQYRDLFEKTKTRSFVSIGSENGICEKLVAQKNLLISKFLRIAREYVQLENFTVRSSRLVCESCSGSEFEQSDDEAIYTCKQCGNTLELLDDSPTYKDTDRVNMASRYQYTCRGHFIEAMNKFEGKQNTTIPKGVRELLEREMKNHNLTVETTSKDHIYMFLAEKKLSAHYEDINLIYYMITGASPPNITEYRPKLLELFDLQEEAYLEVKDPGRTNSLNVNYKLYKLLQLVGYPCKKDDFYILRTRTKLEEHDEKWREIIEILKKNHPDQKIWRFIGTL